MRSAVADPGRDDGQEEEEERQRGAFSFDADENASGDEELASTSLTAYIDGDETVYDNLKFGQLQLDATTALVRTRPCCDA